MLSFCLQEGPCLCDKGGSLPVWLLRSSFCWDQGQEGAPAPVASWSCGLCPGQPSPMLTSVRAGPGSFLSNTAPNVRACDLSIYGNGIFMAFHSHQFTWLQARFCRASFAYLKKSGGRRKARMGCGLERVTWKLTLIICKIDSQWQFAVWLGNSNPAL